MCEKYNGWSNRETWLVNLWFGDNWESVEDVQSTREYLEEEIDKLPNWIRDFIDDAAIDWEELESHFEEN